MSEIAYAYLRNSALLTSSEGSVLDIATSSGTGTSLGLSHPFFFSGFVEHPEVVAQALLVLARISRTRFYVPPNTLAAELLAADPVVTSTPDGLRFEVFSVCGGVYARLDISEAALDAQYIAHGVTNVDINPPLRQALAGLRASEPLHMNIGDEHLRVTTLGAEAYEKRVPLPSRWLKGFAETQLLCAQMTQIHELDAAMSRQFVRALPKSSSTKTVLWATQSVRGLRLAATHTRGALCVAGPERLRVIEPLVRFSTRLRGYGSSSFDTGQPSASAWVLDLPGARLSIGLSPEKSRGFSGEGAMLHALRRTHAAQDAENIGERLNLEARIDTAELAHDLRLEQARVQDALDLLAGTGQVGFDLAAQSYFHRPLPVPEHALCELHPRLNAARELFAAQQIIPAGLGSFTVFSAQNIYQVVQAETAEQDRCTCPWYAKYRGSRGPCKHVLATRLYSDSTQHEGSVS